MHSQKFKFSSAATTFYFNSSLGQLKNVTDKRSAILITDENIHSAHAAKFRGWKTIVIKAGEQYKNQDTVNLIIDQLIQLEADRKTMLVGVGGGVVTDITGYAASVYMRGVPFGFVPSSVLAMVDASIGGKNGIDVGLYKNMVGIIRQPVFILHDMSLLKSLPHAEWVNGFAEVIKHACIKDAMLFRELEAVSLGHYMRNRKAMAQLVERNARIKARVVQKDEFEKNERRLLNFGHTLGHALENQYALSHGQAVAIGIHYACLLSGEITGFLQSSRVENVLKQYELPTHFNFDPDRAMSVLKMDKKRERKDVHYILLQKIGKAVVRSLPLTDIEKKFRRLL